MSPSLAAAGRWLLSCFTVLLTGWSALAGYFVQACPHASEGLGWAVLIGVLVPVAVPWVAIAVLVVMAPIGYGLARVSMSPSRRLALTVAAPLAVFALVWAVAGLVGAKERCTLGF